MLGINPNCQETLPRNCNNTIAATLDLTQSIKNEEQTIAAQISLTDVCQWDGRTVLSLEQSIRKAALILAGQCMVLLHKLSQSKSAQITANKQTHSWRHPKSKGNGGVQLQVLCVGNVVVTGAITR